MTRLIVTAAALVATSTLPVPDQRATRPAPAPRAERPVPFAAGETLTYDVSWSSYLTAGTAVTTVQQKKPSFNSTAYYIVAEGRPTPLLSKLYTLYYKMDTLVDVFTLLSQRGSLYSEEGRRRRYQTTAFDRASNRAHVEVQTGSVAKEDIAVPAGTQDVLSTIFALRSAPLVPGTRLTVPVTDRGNTYLARFDVGAVERVSVPAGSFEAWKIAIAASDETGQAVGRNLALWISTDARRLPVRLQAELKIGSAALTLRQIK